MRWSDLRYEGWSSLTQIKFDRDFIDKDFAPSFFFPTLGAWCAGVNNKQQYLQIDFQGMRKVTQVASQGRPDSNDYVSSYMISFSLDGNLFEFHRLVSFFRLIFPLSQAAVLVSCVE